MTKADYYEILQVSKTADDKVIKSAYRKLAFQYHPDKNQGDKAAEQKFKEASEAYEVLSTPEKRSIYDRFGHEGLRGAGGQGFTDIEDIFSSFGDIFSDFFGGGSAFGGGNRQKRSRARRGNDVRYDLTIQFKDAAFGIKKTIDITDHVGCETCSGTGSKAGSQPQTCQACKGRGQVVHGQGMFIISTTCPECGGEGVFPGDPCPDCRGRGHRNKKTQMNVDIPAGFQDGMSLRYTGKGEAGAHGGPSGDLYIVVKVEEDSVFKRDGDDLYLEIPISIALAALGGTKKVPTLEGEDEIKIKPGTQPGSKLVLRRKGVANVRSGQRGDQVIIFDVVVPKDLTKEQRDLLEQFAQTLDDGQIEKLNKKKGFFGL